MGYVRSPKGKEVSTTPWYLNQASDTKFSTALRSFTEGPWEPGVYHSIPVYCVRCMVAVNNIPRGIYVDVHAFMMIYTYSGINVDVTYTNI